MGGHPFASALIMTLIQLRYFAAVVDARFNISRAAAALHTSQPGISRQIRLLEKQLGTELLARRNGRIAGLTESGAQALKTARRILKESDSLRMMSEDFLHQESGTLTVATLHTMARTLLPKPVAALRGKYPGVTIKVTLGSPREIVDMVRSGDADIGIAIDTESTSPGLLSLALMSVPRALIVPAGHPLLKVKRPSLREIARYPMICMDSLAGDWSVTQAFAHQGIDIKVSVFAPDASAIKAYVEEGAGVAFINGALYDARQDRQLRSIDVRHIVGPSQYTIVIDPHRYRRQYFYDLLAALSPRWTRQQIDVEVRDAVLAGE
jgi:DNA-binding transcriptional LysR family regulator